MIALETERLTLRNFSESDWEALHTMIVQYEASELGAYDQPWPTAPEEIRKIAAWFASSDAYFAVCLKARGQFIGFVSPNPEPAPTPNHDFNIGYVFNFDYHGQGYATEACRAVLCYAFRDLQAQRVITGTAAVNRASCRLLERLGFTKTGETPTSFQNGPDGKPVEFLGFGYALTKAAWETRSTS